MRYLVLSDIHANLEALEAVLADAPEYDAVLCLGDLVGYGPNPNECVRLVRALPNLTCLVGNHDWAALGRVDTADFNGFARLAVEWTGERLDSEVRAFLEGLEPKLEGGEFALAHGSPRDPIWEYLDDESLALANFDLFDAPFCLVGHTHVPRVFECRENGHGAVVEMVRPAEGDIVDLSAPGRWIINPGGVGQPRDGDFRAAYGILDTEAHEFTFRRVRYSVDVTDAKIRNAGLPAVLGQRLHFGM